MEYSQTPRRVRLTTDKITKYDQICTKDSLSKAQKVPAPKTSELDKIKKNIMKTIAKELKLAKEHPLVVAEFKARWNKWVSNLSGWRKLRLGLK